jgi:DNA-binding response OmpR family regulator
LTRLLVADDSETVLLMLKRRLEMSGYDVLTATDGHEAVARVEEAGGELDLLLLDAMMPGKSGIDALREIRASGVKTPALIISAHLDAQEPGLLEEIGADGCVPKPFEWESLLERIDELAAP